MSLKFDSPAGTNPIDRQKVVGHGVQQRFLVFYSTAVHKIPQHLRYLPGRKLLLILFRAVAINAKRSEAAAHPGIPR